MGGVRTALEPLKLKPKGWQIWSWDWACVFLHRNSQVRRSSVRKRWWYKSSLSYNSQPTMKEVRRIKTQNMVTKQLALFIWSFPYLDQECLLPIWVQFNLVHTITGPVQFEIKSDHERLKMTSKTKQAILKTGWKALETRQKGLSAQNLSKELTSQMQRLPKMMNYSAVTWRKCKRTISIGRASLLDQVSSTWVFTYAQIMLGHSSRGCDIFSPSHGKTPNAFTKRFPGSEFVSK